MVPDIILSQLDAVHSLATGVYCRGAVALSQATTNNRVMGTSIAVSFLSGLYADLYQESNTAVIWQTQTNTDQVIMEQLVNAEIAAYNVTLDMQTIGLILMSCVTHWNDPAVLRQNPWLATLIPSLDDQPVPTLRVVSCYTSLAGSPMGQAMYNSMFQYLSETRDPVLGRCVANGSLSAAYYSCTNVPESGLLITSSESTISSQVAA